MKFYTLTYNCNTPTTQQINVPTNTDYKVGIKVVRNGKEQNLKPAEVTLGTLSADQDDINGYTTFTLSAGDDASYTQETIDIQHGYESAFYKPAFVEQNTTGATETVTIISADLSDFVGYTLKPEDVYYSAMYRRSELSVSQIEESFGPYWRVNEDAQSAVEFKPFIEDKDGNPKMYLVVTQAWYQEYCNALGWPIDKPGFFVPKPDNTMNIVETYTVQEGDRLVMGKGLNVSKDRWFGGKISITVGTPFDAQFKLNTNVFKSQEGNIGAFSGNANTVKFAGQTVDGTEFSYDLVLN